MIAKSKGLSYSIAICQAFLKNQMRSQILGKNTATF